MENAKLSIVIPHYNSPKTLRVLLNSIPCSNEIKVIVVDDNSTKYKEEYEHLKIDFNGRNVVFLTNYTNKNSAGTCRNIGMEQAEGNWIMFADADDYYMDGWYNIVEQYFTSDYDIVFFSPTSIQLDTGEKDIRHIDICKKIIACSENPNKENELSVRYLFPEPWSKLFNRKFIIDEKINFEDIIASNDSMFSIKSGYFAKKIICTSKCIYCVTRSKGSLTTIINRDIADIKIKSRVRRAGFLYSHLNEDEIKMIEMDKIGLRVIYDGIKYGKGAFKYIKYLAQNKVPVVKLKYLNPLLVVSKLHKFKTTEKKLKNYSDRYNVENFR